MHLLLQFQSHCGFFLGKTLFLDFLPVDYLPINGLKFGEMLYQNFPFGWGRIDDEVLQSGKLEQSVEEEVVDLGGGNSTLMGLLEMSRKISFWRELRGGMLLSWLPWRDSSLRFLNLLRS